jgi:hypothetical protein
MCTANSFIPNNMTSGHNAVHMVKVMTCRKITAESFMSQKTTDRKRSLLIGSLPRIAPHDGKI